ncbi:hypothetical protein V6N12_030768 [Hibiscus sabdariffa]|uniref:Uncharacterized protein n=1 Tax=Hibiscus sabdariffa TaxID=183260 RepID=A0ABR2EAH3_9ROSI
MRKLNLIVNSDRFDRPKIM